MIVRMTFNDKEEAYYIRCFAENRLRTWNTWYSGWDKILKKSKLDGIVKEKVIQLIKDDYTVFKTQSLGKLSDLKYRGIDMIVDLVKSVTEKDEGSSVIYYFAKTGDVVVQ